MPIRDYRNGETTDIRRAFGGLSETSALIECSALSVSLLDGYADVDYAKLARTTEGFRQQLATDPLTLRVRHHVNARERSPRAWRYHQLREANHLRGTFGNQKD